MVVIQVGEMAGEAHGVTMVDTEAGAITGEVMVDGEEHQTGLFHPENGTEKVVRVGMVKAEAGAITGEEIVGEVEANARNQDGITIRMEESTEEAVDITEAGEAIQVGAWAMVVIQACGVVVMVVAIQASWLAQVLDKQWLLQVVSWPLLEVGKHSLV